MGRINYSQVVTKEELYEIGSEKDAWMHEQSEHYSIDACALKDPAVTAKSIIANNKSYTNLSKQEKTVLAANIAFDCKNDIVINLLINYGISRIILHRYAMFVTKIKKMYSLDPLCIVEDDEIKKLHNKLIQLCNLVSPVMESEDYTLILTQLTDLMVFHKDLFKKPKVKAKER